MTIQINPKYQHIQFVEPHVLAAQFKAMSMSDDGIKLIPDGDNEHFADCWHADRGLLGCSVHFLFEPHVKRFGLPRLVEAVPSPIFETLGGMYDESGAALNAPTSAFISAGWPRQQTKEEAVTRLRNQELAFSQMLEDMTWLDAAGLPRPALVGRHAYKNLGHGE